MHGLGKSCNAWGLHVQNQLVHKLILYTKSACAMSTTQAEVFGLSESCQVESGIAVMLCQVLCARAYSNLDGATAAKDEERQ